MKKKLGVVSMVMGLMMIVSAFAMIVYNNNEEEQAAAASDAVLSYVRGYIQQDDTQELQGMSVEEFADVPDAAQNNTDQQDAQNGQSVSESLQTEEQTERPQLIVNNAEIDTSVVYVAQINGNNYIGYLTIPKLGLELPVMADWSYSRLRTAPCRYSGLHYGDDMVIAAHNYKRHFGDIIRLTPGDTVVFTDMQGLQLVYTVGLVETLAPNEIDRMVNSDWDLTLFTCTYGGANRVTVRCQRT